MARRDPDHPRADHPPSPSDPRPEPSMHVIDADAGAGGEPGDPLDQFVSEFAGESEPPSQLPVHATRVPSQTPGALAAGRSRMPAAMPLPQVPTRWLDAKTMVTVVITMVLTMAGMAVGLRFAQDRRAPPAAGSPAPERDTTEGPATAAGVGTLSPSGTIQRRGRDIRLDATEHVAEVPQDRRLPVADGEVDDDWVSPDARRTVGAVEIDGLQARVEPDPFDWDRGVGARGTRATSPVSSRAPLPEAADRTAARTNVPALAATDVSDRAIELDAAPLSRPLVVPVSRDIAARTTVTLSDVPVPDVEERPAMVRAPGADVPRPVEAAAPAGAAVAAPDRIRDVIARYQRAFSALDAGAAHAVWPSVDVRALERAFGSLETQHVELRNCRITVNDPRASATCGGTLRYVPRVGRKSERVEQRQFQFELRRVDDVWSIEEMESR